MLLKKEGVLFYQSRAAVAKTAIMIKSIRSFSHLCGNVIKQAMLIKDVTIGNAPMQLKASYLHIP